MKPQNSSSLVLVCLAVGMLSLLIGFGAGYMVGSSRSAANEIVTQAATQEQLRQQFREAANAIKTTN